MKPISILNWDSAVKVSDKMGSSPGGIYLSPGGKKYYVKFSGADNDDRIANEYLANQIYRHMCIAIPDVLLVTIDGKNAHASQFLDRDETIDLASLKDGFILDALLANWDIVAHLDEPIQTNIICHKGVLYRIDNGGALLFRARGQRKTVEQFNETVIELETMRGCYSDLTGGDIKAQIETLKRNLPHDSIDRLVGTTPLLSDIDADFLKDILEKRRDYIVEHASLI